MLAWRLVISVVLVPALLGLFWWDARLGPSAWVLLTFCLLAGLRNTFELTGLLALRAMQPSWRITSVCSVLIVAAGWMHVWTDSGAHGILGSLGWIAAAVTLCVLVLLTREAFAFRERGHAMETLGAHLLTLLYGSALLAVTAQFRWFPSEPLAYFALGSMVIAVKCGDIGAYSFGRLWGRRKMAPYLSPGKTWMGFVGALVGSTVGGSLWIILGLSLFAVPARVSGIANILAYCAVLGVTGLLGDLCESLIKRDCGKKDSAEILPGFGGLLDLLDSPLFAGPVALAWWHWMPPAILL